MCRAARWPLRSLCRFCITIPGGPRTTNYAFVIDQNSCIGCHACTVACKAENDVPLGVFRTWVKYVEKGQFPNTRRHFLVQRCNHCANPPCVTICPTQAMFKRKDGIVDFDSSRCIGCKACMQACPYDAIYIDPASHTAAKCNFCAHRTEVGLQPACVIVCPVEAIISGDLDDPNSRVSQLIGRSNVQQRRTDQGTQPKLWYIGAAEVAINPEFFEDSQGSMWAQHHSTAHGFPAEPVLKPRQLESPASFASEQHPAAPGQSVAAGLLAEGGQVDYNVAHEQPWGFLVAAYLWTKSIGAGAFLMLALTVSGLSYGPFTLAAVLVSLVFIGITSALLVADLKHPERFLYILTKPNFRSWLVWGAYILIAFGAVAGLASLDAFLGRPVFTPVVLWPGVVLALLAAGYSGFLFGQAEGRDFWQSPLLPVHLLVQAALAGSAAMLLVGLTVFQGTAPVGVLALVLTVALVLHLLFAAAELYTPHANAHVKLAARHMTSGQLGRKFWLGAIGLGGLLPLALIGGLALFVPGRFDLSTAIVVGIAASAALVGLLIYEDAWVTAGQSVPMS